jgi:hypothetical protein
VAGQVDFTTFEDRWKIAMVQTKEALPDLSRLANREGGYVEQIENQNVAWTPRNMYLFTFPQNIIGFAVPANRQKMADWLRGTLVKPRTFPPSWADRALFRADSGSQIVVAIDLTDQFAPQQAERWLRSLDDVAEKRLDPKLMAPQLASVKSAFLQVDFKNGISGTLQVEFDKEITALKPLAKKLVLEAIDQAGAEIDDLKTWDADTSDKAIRLTGSLTEPAVRRLLSVLGMPRLTQHYESLGNTPAPAPEANKAASNDKPATVEPSDSDVIKASQQYFRSVVDIVDDLKRMKNEKYSRIRLWLDRSAKEIDELPLLNVDNELLEWGTKVSLTLREMSMSINSINKEKSYVLASSAKGSYIGWGGYGSYASVDSRATKTQADAMINVDATARWTALQTAIGDMRKKLVQKYKVDF